MTSRADIGAHVWSLISQALNSGRSVAFAIVAAGLLDADDFGLVAIVVGASIAVNGLLRSWCSHPLALVDDAPEADHLTAAVRQHVVAALGFAAAAALVAALAGAPSPLLLGAVVTPLVAAQDATRVGALNLGLGRLAALSDAVWVVGLTVGLVVCVVVDVDDPAPLLAVWALTAAVAAVTSLVVHRQRDRRRLVSVREFDEVFGGRGRQLALQLGLETIPVRVLPLVVTAVVAVSEAGALRGAETLLGGATVVWSAVSLSVLRQARAHARTGDGRSTLRFVAVTMVVPLVVVGANAGVAALISDDLGEWLLGETWTGAIAILPAVTALLAAQVVLGVVATALRAIGRDDVLRSVLAVAAVSAVVAVPIAASAGGVNAALYVDAGCLLVAAVLGARRVLESAPVDAEAGHDDHEERPASAG